MSLLLLESILSHYSEPLFRILYYMHLFMILKNELNLNLIHNTTDNLDVALYAHLCSDKYIEIVDGILH